MFLYFCVKVLSHTKKSQRETDFEQRNTDFMNSPLTIYRDLSSIPHSFVKEENRIISAEQGNGHFRFKERSLKNMQIINCDYNLEHQQDLLINVRNHALKMHFRIQGESLCVCDQEGLFSLQTGQHSLMYHQNCETKVEMKPTPKKGKFIEIMLSQDLFEDYFSEGNDFQKNFLEQTLTKSHLWTDQSLTINTEIYSILSELTHSPYHGNLQKFYIEAKVTELLLLQVEAFERKKTYYADLKFTAKEIEQLHYAKELMTQNFQNPLTVKELSRTIGLNTKKLTQGFKYLFGHTIFGFIQASRMQEAEKLLLEDKLYINEVSDYLGYKNPQHFTVAFKKYYSVLPSIFKKYV